MPGKFLLDTDIVLALLAGERAALDYLSRADEVLISNTALGELYYGAKKSTRPTENIALIDEIAAGAVVLSLDSGTALHYLQIRDALRARGRPLVRNDIWTAAAAIQHSLTLVTRDAHFQEIDGLMLEAW